MSRELSFDLIVDGVADSDAVTLRVIDADTSQVIDSEVVDLQSGRNSILFSDARAQLWPLNVQIKASITRHEDGRTRDKYLSIDGSTTFTEILDVVADPVLTPANGATTADGSQVFTVTPRVAGTLYRFDVNGVSGEFTESNTITASVPNNGLGYDVVALIDRQDGRAATVINHKYTAFSASAVYSMLDIARAEITAYASSDEAGNNRIENYTLGETAYIWIELVDTANPPVHINDQDLPFGIRFGDITLGSEGFDRREGTYSVYEYNVPSSNPSNTTPVFTAGVFTDAGQTEANALIAEFTLPIGVQAPASESTPVINSFEPTSSSAALTWSDDNPPQTRNYDIAVDGVDQGPSVVNATRYDLTGLPTDGQEHTIVLSYWDNGDLSNVRTTTIVFTAFEAQFSGLDFGGMQNIDFGSDKALGTIGQSEIDEIMAPLARQFFTPGNRMAVKTVDGRRALCAEIDVDSATDNRPSDRVSFAHEIPDSRTYRIAQWVWVPADFVGGGTKDGNPFGTAKIGYGLYTTVTVSGGERDARGASMRFIYDVETNGDLTPAIYDYSFDRSSDFGGRYEFPNKLIRGAWNFLAMEVTMNSAAGASDGIIRAWQDPNSTTPQIVVRNKRIMASDPPQWTRLRNEIFLGGSGTNGRLYYTPDNDQELCLADVYVGAGSF